MLDEVTWSGWAHDGTKWTQQPKVTYTYVNDDGRKSKQSFYPKDFKEFYDLMNSATQEMGKSTNGHPEAKTAYLKDILANKDNGRDWTDYIGKTSSTTKPTTTTSTPTNTTTNNTTNQNNMAKIVPGKIDLTGTALQVGSRVLSQYGFSTSSVPTSVRQRLGEMAQSGQSWTVLESQMKSSGLTHQNWASTTTTPRPTTPTTPTAPTTPATPTSPTSPTNPTNPTTPTNPTSPSTSLPTIGGSPEARALVQKALNETDLANLQRYAWWSNSPAKNEAFAIIQKGFSSPTNLAALVKDMGTVSLQNKPWWNSSPFKTEAWSLINSATNPTSPTSPTTPTTPATTPTTAPNRNYTAQINAALNIIDRSGLDDSFKSILRTVVEGWDWEGDNIINMDNILTKFRELDRTIISPEFKSKVDAFKAEVIDARNFLQAQRETELEKERLTAGENIRQTKAGLEKSGLTFTGQAIQDLGAESAYAQNQNAATPMQPTEQGMFYEGRVNQLNRLMSQGSESTYRQNMTEIGRKAEEQLGSGNTALLNLPNYSVVGNQRGTIETQRQQALGDVLKGLAAQQDKNRINKDPFFTTDIINQFS